VAILYDRTGNEVFVEDDEVEDKLEETWLVHNKRENRYFHTNPDGRSDKERTAEGVKGVHLRARKKIVRAVLRGDLNGKVLEAAVLEEIEAVKAELLLSEDEKLHAIGEAL
jgi:hypothetical protein